MRPLIAAALYTGAMLAASAAPAQDAAQDLAALRQGDLRKLVLHEAPQPVPDTAFEGEDGAEMTLRDLAGEVVVLNFWATWCPPCRREMPLLDAVQREYGPEGVTIVGIDLEEAPEVVRAYVESVGVGYPIWLDDPSRNAPDRTRGVYTKLGGVGLPTTVFIGRDGVIRGSQVGELSRGVLQNRVESLLARPR